MPTLVNQKGGLRAALRHSGAIMADGGGSFRRRLTARRLYEELLARHEAGLAAAFMDAVEDLRSGVQIRRLEAALAAGNIEEALAALNLDGAAYDRMLEELRAAFMDGGRSTAEGFPRTVGRVRFDGRNPRAESWLSARSSELIRRMSDDQRNSIRTALTTGLSEGASPRATALEITGRVSRVTGRREGGILGLTSAQADQVARARRELSSGTPNSLNHYLTRKARDRRYDRSILKAIRTGQPIPAEIATKAAIAYEARLLKLRGQTIARTETMSALAQGSNEAYRQAIENGTLAADEITKTWRTASDNRVRHSHSALNGTKIGFLEAFVTPLGARMQYPMDTSGGASAEDILNCRCICEYRIDYFARLRKSG